MKLLKGKFKLTKKLVIFLVILVVVGGGIAYSCSLQAKAKSVHTNVSNTILKQTTLRDIVSVSGTVHSNSSVNVYTTLSTPVEKVYASIGDTVKKGQILAILDSSALKKDVEQQTYSTKSSDDGAALSLAKAKSDYENAVSLYNHDLNNDVLTAQNQVSTTKTALDTETSTWNYDQFLYQNSQLSKMELDQEKAKYIKAQNDYNAARKALSAAQNKAQQDLQTAKNTYDAAVVKSADKSQQAVLEKLQQNLRDCSVVAPTGGTITYKSASVGVAPTGILFKIESTSDLIVDTEIKEMDTATVKPGKKVIIKSDATGAAEIPGEVLSVAPAATEKTEGTGNVTFAAKIKVTGSNPNLRIGMKAKLQIIVQQKDHVFVAPYDAVVQKSGKNALMIAEKQGAIYRAREVPVTTGMETDVSVEVSGSGLKDGTIVLNNPEGISAGDVVQPAKGE